MTLTEEEISRIKQLEGKHTQKEIGKIMNISISTVRRYLDPLDYEFAYYRQHGHHTRKQINKDLEEAQDEIKLQKTRITQLEHELHKAKLTINMLQEKLVAKTW